MEIRISEEEIRAIVKEESDKAIRKRIKEMQGDYTSKGYLEGIIREILWDTLLEKIPNLEEYVKDCIDKVMASSRESLDVPSKSELIDMIISELRE